MNQGLLGWPMPRSASVPYINIQDQQTSGTGGGTFTSGAWRTRTLQAVQSDLSGIVNLAANQITLPPGTYRCTISCPAYSVAAHKARLQNITDGTTTLIGTSEFSLNGTSVSSRSWITGKFNITATKVFEVQHQCQTTHATEGFGTLTSFGTEVYTVAEFWKEG